VRAQLRLRLGLVVRSQRAFPLVVALLVAPAVTVPAGGGVADDYLLLGLLALPVTASMTTMVVSTGHASMTQVLVAAAGGRWRVARGSVVIAWALAVTAGTVLSLSPYVLGGRGSAGDWLSGWLCLLACTSAAAGCGLLASREAGRRPALAFLIGAVGILAAATVPGVGPVRVALGAESHHPAVGALAMSAVASLLLVPLAAAAATVGRDVAD
jgi:hypothetical protein